MSTLMSTISLSGCKEVDLEISQFSGGNKGVMLQLTQGFAGSAIGEVGDPGFIQLTKSDAKELVDVLKSWLSENP